MDINLVQKLKDWRNDKARVEGKQPYLVFQNATLEETVKVLPKTKSELKNIKGWGEKKIFKYGDDVIALINNQDNSPNTANSAVFSSNSQELNLQKDILGTDQVFSVSNFLAYFNEIFSSIGQVKIKGEISDISSRGRTGSYAFFDLKDSSGKEAAVKCFIGWQHLAKFSHLLEDGAEVVISGIARLYEKSGGFSITVTNVEPVGEGAWKKAFEQLKKKLEAKGYFDQSRKRALPFYVEKIGLITSEHGAAIRDFMKNLGSTGFEIYFKDVFVEGDYAEKSIVSAISWMNRNIPDLDLIVLIRGGGGLESFKAFNSEAVADAIVTSRLPIITGIGHEKDQSIADFVSDRFFSTPTAVGIFLKEQRRILWETIDAYNQQLIFSAEKITSNFNYLLEKNQNNLKLSLERVLREAKYKLASLTERIHNGANKVVRVYNNLEQRFLRTFYLYESEIGKNKHKLEAISNQCSILLQRNLQELKQKVQHNSNLLDSLNPEAILERGYSIVYSKESKAIKSAEHVQIGDLLDIKLAKGEIISRVERKS